MELLERTNQQLLYERAGLERRNHEISNRMESFERTNQQLLYVKEALEKANQELSKFEEQLQRSQVNNHKKLQPEHNIILILKETDCGLVVAYISRILKLRLFEFGPLLVT